MRLRTCLVALLLVLACGQGVLARDTSAVPKTVTVRPGDTATSLAQKLRPEGATLQQTLVALWRANPRAFGHGELNHLLQGATLKVPSERQILSLSPARAHALVVEQVDNFQVFVRQQQSPPAAAASASVAGLDASQWTRALAEAQAIKDALEQQSRDTQTRLAQLEKNIQTLQAMQSASSPGTPASAVNAATAASEAASESVNAPTTEASAPEASASEASAPVAEASSTASEPASASASGTGLALPEPVLWTAGLLAVMLVLALAVRRGSRTAAPAQASPIDIPPQMARIDLNLDSPPSGPAGQQDPRP